MSPSVSCGWPLHACVVRVNASGSLRRSSALSIVWLIPFTLTVSLPHDEGRQWMMIPLLRHVRLCLQTSLTCQCCVRASSPPRLSLRLLCLLLSVPRLSMNGAALCRDTRCMSLPVHLALAFVLSVKWSLSRCRVHCSPIWRRPRGLAPINPSRCCAPRVFELYEVCSVRS